MSKRTNPIGTDPDPRHEIVAQPLRYCNSIHEVGTYFWNRSEQHSRRSDGPTVINTNGQESYIRIKNGMQIINAIMPSGAVINYAKPWEPT